MPASVYKTKKRKPCATCGQMTNRRRRETCQPMCLDCSIKRMADAASQINQERGEFYDAWLAGMAKAISERSTGGGGGCNLFPSRIPACITRGLRLTIDLVRSGVSLARVVSPTRATGARERRLRRIGRINAS